MKFVKGRRTVSLVVLQFVLFFTGTLVWMGDLKPHLSDLWRYMYFGKSLLHREWPYIDFPMEYPPGAAVYAALVSWPSRNDPMSDRSIGDILPWMFIISAAACAFTTLCLYQTKGPQAGRQKTALQFLFLTLLTTPLAAYRYDTLPMAATAGAVWAFDAEAYVLCGAACGIGTVLKLYPAAFLVVAGMILAIGKKGRDAARLGLGYVVIVVIPFLIYLPTKMPLAPLSFLDYHIDRGLQIESTWAGFALLARDLLRIPTGITSRFGALELDSPLVSPLLWIQKVTFPAGVLTCTAFCVWIAARTREARINRVWVAGRLFCLLLTITLSLSKVFSPQYIIWLLPFMALGGRRRFFVASLAVLLTMCIYPLWMKAYVVMTVYKMIAVNCRNALLILLAAIDARSLWLLADRTNAQPSDANSASASAN